MTSVSQRLSGDKIAAFYAPGFLGPFVLCVPAVKSPRGAAL